jgi:hypothetical protein
MGERVVNVTQQQLSTWHPNVRHTTWLFPCAWVNWRCTLMFSCVHVSCVDLPCRGKTVVVGPNAGSAWGGVNGEPLFLSLGLSFLRLFRLSYFRSIFSFTLLEVQTLGTGKRWRCSRKESFDAMSEEFQNMQSTRHNVCILTFTLSMMFTRCCCGPPWTSDVQTH